MLNQHIFGSAASLKKKYQTNNPFRLAEDLGIYVSFRPLNRLKGFYCICIRERHIVINNELGDENRLVVCAHELGHDRLHREIAKIAALKDFVMYDFKSKPEYEANVFAAELLLDDAEVLEAAKDSATIFAAAKLLEVPPELLDFKLRVMREKGYAWVKAPMEAQAAFLK